MVIKLNLGFKTYIDEQFNEQDVYECVLPLENMIPRSHEYLLNFLKADLLKVKDLITHAIEKGDRSFTETAFNLLQKVHPYLDKEFAAIYINKEIYKIASKDGRESGKETKTKFVKACLSEPGSEESTLDHVRSIIYRDSRGSVSSLIDLQEELNRLVSLYFMDSNPAMAKIPLPVRAGLYGLVSINPRGLVPDSEPKFMLPESKYVLSYPSDIRLVGAKMDFEEGFAAKVYNAINSIDHYSDKIPEILENLVNSVHCDDRSGDYTEYTINFLEDLLWLDVYLMASDNIRLRKCAKCGKIYAVTMDSDFSPYCDYPDKKGNSCRKQAVRKELVSNISRNYTRAYKRHFSRVANGKETQDELNAWMDKMRVLKSKVLSGEITLDNYILNL